MDCLERKMDSLHAELSHYRGRCQTLEAQNAALMAQLRKLQAATSGSGAADGKLLAIVVSYRYIHCTYVLSV